MKKTAHSLLFTTSLLVVSQVLFTAILWFFSQYWWSIQDGLQVNISYLFTATYQELRSFYPNFYFFIFITTRVINYILPVVAVLFLFRSRKGEKWSSLMVGKQDNDELHFVKKMVVPFVVTFGVALMFYFTLRPLSIKPFWFQLALTKIFLGLNVLNLLWILVTYSEDLKERLFSFLGKAVLPYSLAMTRILFFGYMIYLYLIVYGAGKSSNIGELDKVALPFIGWLIELIPVSPTLYISMCVLGAMLSFGVMLGYRTRLFLILNAIVVFYVVATPNFFGKLSHQQLVIWISWIMAFSPCADVLSIDSLKKTSPVEAKPEYGFHLKIIWLQLGVIYFFAGFYKWWISGFDWSLTHSMINLLQIEWFEHYDLIPSFRIDNYPTFLKLGGTAVIFFEMAYIFMLFNKRTKWLSIIGGLVMHNVIGTFMYIFFSYLLQAFYIVYIPWNWIFKKIGKVKEGLKINTQVPQFKSLVYAGPLFILCANITFSVFNINSYPFSIYPIYTDIVPDNVQYFDYRILDKGKEYLNFRDEGREANFRWEDFSRTEYHIIRTLHNVGELDSAGVYTLWRRWQLNIPIFNDVDSVEVFIVERPLQPEQAADRVSEEYLLTILPNDLY